MPKFLVAIAITLLSLMAVSPAVAQLNGTDLGNPDSVFIEITRYADDYGEFSVTVDLYLYNDVQDIFSIVCFLQWDNPLLTYDSIQWSQAADFAFNPSYVFDPPDVDSVNVWQQLPFVGMAAGSAGLALPANSEPKLLATYYMHLTTGSDESPFCIDAAAGIEIGLLATDSNAFVPVWRGPVCSEQASADLGWRDSIYVELSQIEESGQHHLLMDLYFFNDQNSLQGGLLVYTWDHPGFYFDSVVISSIGEAGFTTILSLPSDTAMKYGVQSIALVSFDAGGFPPDPSARLVGTVYSHLTLWNSGDSICIDTGFFPDTVFYKNLKTVFVDANGSRQYKPLWPGSVCLELEGVPTDVKEFEQAGLPDDFSLSQNYPNPFNPSTSIEYSLTHSSEVIMTVMNLLGQTVATLNQGRQGPGQHRVNWHGTDDAGHHVASGIYFYRLEIDDQVQTRKMLLLK